MATAPTTAGAPNRPAPRLTDDTPTYGSILECGGRSAAGSSRPGTNFEDRRDLVLVSIDQSVFGGAIMQGLLRATGERGWFIDKSLTQIAWSSGLRSGRSTDCWIAARVPTLMV